MQDSIPHKPIHKYLIFSVDFFCCTMYNQGVLDLGSITYAAKQRRLYIVGEITDISMMNATETLILAEKEFRTRPFEIIMNTGGGDVTAALGFCDLLRSMPYEITTTCMGEVASAGIFILAAADIRQSLPNTSFLWHGVFWNGDGRTPEEMNQDAVHFVKFEQACSLSLQEWTDNPRIMEDLGPRRWFNNNEAKTMGLLNA